MGCDNMEERIDILKALIGAKITVIQPLYKLGEKISTIDQAWLYCEKDGISFCIELDGPVRVLIEDYPEDILLTIESVVKEYCEANKEGIPKEKIILALEKEGYERAIVSSIIDHLSNRFNSDARLIEEDGLYKLKDSEQSQFS